MSDPTCRDFRELLGVYVVGAIEPHERSLVDAHLNQCYECREELAGLAVLPALLHRIPVAEAEELARPMPVDAEVEDPAPAVLDGLITDVRARRRTRRLRTVLAAAAVVIVAAGSGVAVSTALSGSPQSFSQQALDVATAHTGGVSGTVKYGQSPRGTVIWAKVGGIPEWTQCKLWVVTADGHSEEVGGWTVGYGGDGLWYPSLASVPSASVTAFLITSGHKVLLRIPAT